MATVKLLRMKGFKSFPKNIEIPFGTGYNCIIGPNGSGKCLHADSEVFLADGSIVKIGDLVEQKFNTNKYRKIDDGFIISPDDTKILCFDKDSLKIKSKHVSAFVKRTSPESLVKIRTSSGREVIATEYHPLFVLSNREIKSVRSDELHEGMRIMVPRTITINSSLFFSELVDEIEISDKIYSTRSDISKILKGLKKTTWGELSKELDIPYYALKGILDGQAFNMAHGIKILKRAKFSHVEIATFFEYGFSNKRKKFKMPWFNSAEFSRFLGYVIAEGRPSESNQLWFTNGDVEIVSDYSSLVRSLFGIDVSINEYKPNCFDVLAYSAPLIKILRKFGFVAGAENKFLSNVYLSHCTNAELSHLLDGLLSGDGYSGKSVVDVVTKSSRLSRGVESVLMRLGIQYSIKDVYKIATNSGFSGKYKYIAIHGEPNLEKISKIQLHHSKKRSRIESMLGKKINPNKDLVDANWLVKQVVKDLSLNVKKLKKSYPRLDSYCYNQCTPSTYGLNVLVNEVFIPNAVCNKIQSENLEALKILVSSDVIWDEVVEIEKIKSDQEWVYDLSVDEDHNFVANGIFVHNSNIMDAFTFVLGKTSAKSMRAEKSANLIYHGGKKGTPAKEALVEIVFDNSDGTFVLKDKEITVSRMVKQSGQSAYGINGETVTRQQVVDLLASSKIDPDSHNIILQGDIVRFMEMKSEERRHIIEDVSGISIYEDKKDKAMSELTKVDSKLNEVKIILAEREAYMRELKKDRDQAKKYKELEENIRSNKATFLHLQMRERKEKQEDFEKKINELNGQKEKILKGVQELREKVDAKKTELESINKDVESRGESEQKQLHREIEDLKTEDARQSSRLSVCKSELEKLASRKSELEKNLDEVKKKIASLQSAKKYAADEDAKFRKEEEKINRDIEKFREAHNLTGEVSSLDKLDEEFDSVQKEIEELQTKKSELVRDRDRAMFNLSQLGGGDKEKVRELKEMKVKFKDVTTKLGKSLTENSSLVSQLSNARRRMFEADEKVQKLSLQNAAAKSISGMDLGIKKILEMKDKGVYGTISELGKVSSKYALAMEVAAGGRLKSVVVDTDSTAAKCIAYLKEHRLGVVTFLPVNKMKERGESPGIAQLVKSAGVLGRAVDLVDFERKFEKVFSFVFADTLIVEDMNAARKIGVGRARMVTLQGDLLEVSGAMVGGFRRRVEGLGFKEKDVEEGLAKWELEVAESRRLVDLLESRLEENQDIVQKLREEKAELEGTILKFEKAYGVEDPDALREKQTSLQASIKESERSLRDVEATIAKLLQRSQKLRELRSRAKESLKSTNVTAELEKLNRSRQEVRERMIEFQSVIKNAEQQIRDLYEPELGKMQRLLQGCADDVVKFKAESSDIDARLKQLQSELRQKESAEKKFYADFRGLFEKRNKLAEVIQKVELQVVKEEERVRSVEQRVQVVELDRAKVVAELAGLEQEFEEFKDEKIRRAITIDELKKEMHEFEQMMKNLGSVNLRALEIYEAAEKEYEEILGKMQKLELEKDDVLSLIADIDGKKRELFMKTFQKLHKNFKEIFSQLSTKGEALLLIEDEENLFESGVDIQMKITGNKLLDIKSMSGGEKTMAALAFIFAIQEFEPAAFYLLDEVDAALDKRNSELLSKLIKKYSASAQYIVISHNDTVITEADQVFGVSMQEMISKVVSLKL